MSGAYAQNIAEVYPLGPCQVLFNSNDLGHTDESGAKLTLKLTAVEMMVAKYGKAAVGVAMNGQSAEVEFTLSQTDMTILSSAIPGATIVTNGSNLSKLAFGQYAATLLTPQLLVLKPFVTPAGAPTANWTMLAVPVGDFTPTYEGAKWTGYKCKFMGIINEAGAANGFLMGQFGDSTITADTGEVTVSSVVPTNAGSSITGNTIVWTFNKPLQGNTINSTSVNVLEDSSSVYTVVTGTLALVNNGSSTTLTFTAGTNWTASKTYIALLSPSILGQNQESLEAGAGYSSYFTT